MSTTNHNTDDNSTDTKSTVEGTSESPASRSRLAASVKTVLARGTITLVSIAMLALPAAASEHPSICRGEASFIGGMIGDAFGFFIPAMVSVAILTWVVTSFTESIPGLPREMKKKIKKNRNGSLASMGRGMIVPSMLMVFIGSTGVVELPSCVSSGIPFSGSSMVHVSTAITSMPADLLVAFL